MSVLCRTKLKLKMKLLFVIHTTNKTIFNELICLTEKTRLTIGPGAKVKIICCHYQSYSSKTWSKKTLTR